MLVRAHGPPGRAVATKAKRRQECLRHIAHGASEGTPGVILWAQLNDCSFSSSRHFEEP